LNITVHKFKLPKIFEAEGKGFILIPVPPSAQMLFRFAPQHNRYCRGYFGGCGTSL